mmetsp:Transcript_93540/g.166399  ORF Transcript_93540/g.166399 Transcript_93540/m.166399 type:complete len:204 (-) Transcript_93540:53-664(-)
MKSSTGLDHVLGMLAPHSAARTASSFEGSSVKLPPVMPLPPPPSAAAAQWAQHAYTASTQAAAAKAAAAKAAEVAAAQAAAAQAAATQAQVAQVSAQQAAAAQVAQSLGYNVAPVGVPTAAAYGDMPSAAPPYGLSSPNPLPTAAAGVGPWLLIPSVLAAPLLEGVFHRRNTMTEASACGSEFLALLPAETLLEVQGAPHAAE